MLKKHCTWVCACVQVCVQLISILGLNHQRKLYKTDCVLFTNYLFCAMILIHLLNHVIILLIMREGWVGGWMVP